MELLVHGLLHRGPEAVPDLAAVDASLGDVVFSRVFIQDPADVPVVMGIVGEKFRGINPATTVTCPPLGSTVYKVELEMTAWRGASWAEVETRTVAYSAQ